jgi:hypothetical protein
MCRSRGRLTPGCLNVIVIPNSKLRGRGGVSCRRRLSVPVLINVSYGATPIA